MNYELNIVSHRHEKKIGVLHRNFRNPPGIKSKKNKKIIGYITYYFRLGRKRLILNGA